jgi:hypothetical protein
MRIHFLGAGLFRFAAKADAKQGIKIGFLYSLDGYHGHFSSTVSEGEFGYD